MLLATLLVGCELKSLPGGLQGPAFDGVSQTIPLIVGTLVDGSGQPVEGAKVRAYVAPYRIEALSTEPAAAVETMTDTKGTFRLDSPPLGTVAVEARGRGLKALRTGVAVSSGATVELGTLSLHPTGRISGKVTAPGGVSLLGTDVFIPGTDYLAKAAADGSYSIQDVPVGTYQLAAVRPNFHPRVIEGVSVFAGQTTTPSELALSLDAPVLTSLNPESGGSGTVVTLRGENFGSTKLTSFQVTFNDTLAVTARRISDTEIQATVPIGATTGGVLVRSNGISSQALPFQVISRLTLSPNNMGLYPGASFAYSFQALNDRGDFVASPFVTWALRDPSIGTVSAQGTFQSSREGVTELEARSGLIVSAAWIGVSRYRITTLYGNGQFAYTGDNGLAREASFRRPFTLAKDASGSLYVSDGNMTVIRRVSPDGVITRFAGVAGRADATGDGGPALEAALGEYSTIAVDPLNRLWVSDQRNHVVRFIPLDDRDPAYRAGYVYRAAGTGSPGYTGSGLPGSQTALNRPSRLLPSAAGVYIPDHENHRIRLIQPDFSVVDVLGTGLTPLLSTPVPEASANVSSPVECVLDRHGNMVIACRQQLLFWCRDSGTYFGRSMQAGWVYPLLDITPLRPFVGDGTLSSASYLTNTPLGLQFDGEGTLWFADDCLVRRITPQGRIETIAGKPLEAAHRQSFGFDGEGTNSLVSSLGEANDLLLDGTSLYVVDSGYSRIRLLQRVE